MDKLNTKLVLCLFLPLICLVKGNVDEKKLLKDLLKDYNTDVSPIRNASEAVKVQLGLTILSLLGVNENQHTLETITWLNEEWNDFNLRWDPKDYGNVSVIKLPCAKIWRPDIYFYNHGRADISFTETLAVIKSNGNISVIRPGNVETTCQFDLKYFPRDTYTCEMKLGSWAHDGFQIDLHLNTEKGIDLSSFKETPLWKLESAGAKRNVNFYSCCPEPYHDVVYKLILRRKGEDTEEIACHLNRLITGILVLAVMLKISANIRTQLGFAAIIISFATAVLLCPESAPSFINAPLLVKHFISSGFLGLYVLFWIVSIQYIYCLNSSMPQWLKSLTIDGKIMKAASFCVPSLNEGASRTDLGIDSNPIAPNQLQSNNRVYEILSEAHKSRISRDWVILAIFIDRIVTVIWICVILIFSFVNYPDFPSE